MTYRIRLVESDPRPTSAFYNVVANPMLWFIQHYLWDLSNAPDIRQAEVDAYEEGYCAVNRDLADAVLEEIEGVEAPVVMLHDYHLYTAPKYIREARPDVFLHHFVHIPWTQPDAWRVLPRDMREDIFEGILANDIVAFHTRSYRRNFLLCCREPVRPRGGRAGRASCGSTTARCGCAPTRSRSPRRPSAATPSAPPCTSTSARSCAAGAST